MRQLKDEIALRLLDQIIEEAEREDAAQKSMDLNRHRASQTVGTSWMVFHLRALKELFLD